MEYLQADRQGISRVSGKKQHIDEPVFVSLSYTFSFILVGDALQISKERVFGKSCHVSVGDTREQCAVKSVPLNRAHRIL